MTDVRAIEDKVKAYIVDSFLTGAEAETFRENSELLRILDSLQILRMVLNLEATFGVKVRDGDLTPENLGSVQKIADFLVRQGADPRPGSREPPVSA